jgi:hypothetical protein
MHGQPNINKYRDDIKFTLHIAKQQVSLLGRLIPTRSRRFLSLKLQGAIAATPTHQDTVHDL